MQRQVPRRSRFKRLAQVLLVAVFLSIGVFSPQIIDVLRHNVLIVGDRVDMGTISRGDTIECRFTVWNIAPRTATIALAEPSCTCSVADVSRYVLPPFHSSSIQMKVRTLDTAAGKQMKGIRLTFKDGKTAFPYISFLLHDKPKQLKGSDQAASKK